MSLFVVPHSRRRTDKCGAYCLFLRLCVALFPWSSDNLDFFVVFKILSIVPPLIVGEGVMETVYVGAIWERTLLQTRAGTHLGIHPVVHTGYPMCTLWPQKLKKAKQVSLQEVGRRIQKKKIGISVSM